MLFLVNDDWGWPFILTSSISSPYKIEYNLLLKQQAETISESRFSSLNLEKYVKKKSIKISSCFVMKFDDRDVMFRHEIKISSWNSMAAAAAAAAAGGGTSPWQNKL